MNRIETLKAEIKTLEKDKSVQNFMKLLSNEKMDSINEQLEIIKKRLEIVNILLEKEWVNKKVEEITGVPQDKGESSKSIVEIIRENEHKLSPTVLGLYDWTKQEEEKDIEESVEGKVDIKVNVEAYLEMDNDSEYEEEIIKKLKGLDIREEVDLKPTQPVVVNPEESTSSNNKPVWIRNPNGELASCERAPILLYCKGIEVEFEI